MNNVLSDMSPGHLRSPFGSNRSITRSISRRSSMPMITPNKTHEIKTGWHHNDSKFSHSMTKSEAQTRLYEVSDELEESLANISKLHVTVDKLQTQFVHLK